MMTFIFTVYLTSSYFGSTEQTSSALSLGLTVAGFFIAIFAPVTGQRNDKSGRGIFWLGVNTVLLVVAMAACFFVAPATKYLWLGVLLISAASVFSEFAYVNYNAVLPSISAKENIGKVSGLGWAAGYIGGILALAVVLWGFVMAPETLGLPTEDSLNIRSVALFAALWCLVFCLPLLIRMRRHKRVLPEVLPARELRFLELGLGRLSPARQGSLVASYRALWRSVERLRLTSPQTLWFLIASAVFRDGLSGVFTYGGILARSDSAPPRSLCSVLPVARWQPSAQFVVDTWTIASARRPLLSSRWWVFYWLESRSCSPPTSRSSGHAASCSAYSWVRRSRHPVLSWLVWLSPVPRVNFSACTRRPAAPRASWHPCCSACV